MRGLTPATHPQRVGVQAVLALADTRAGPLLPLRGPGGCGVSAAEGGCQSTRPDRPVQGRSADAGRTPPWLRYAGSARYSPAAARRCRPGLRCQLRYAGWRPLLTPRRGPGAAGGGAARRYRNRPDRPGQGGPQCGPDPPWLRYAGWRPLPHPRRGAVRSPYSGGGSGGAVDARRCRPAAGGAGVGRVRCCGGAGEGMMESNDYREVSMRPLARILIDRSHPSSVVDPARDRGSYEPCQSADAGCVRAEGWLRPATFSTSTSKAPWTRDPRRRRRPRPPHCSTDDWGSHRRRGLRHLRTRRDRRHRLLCPSRRRGGRPRRDQTTKVQQHARRHRRPLRHHHRQRPPRSPGAVPRVPSWSAGPTGAHHRGICGPKVDGACVSGRTLQIDADSDDQPF